MDLADLGCDFGKASAVGNVELDVARRWQGVVSQPAGDVLAILLLAVGEDEAHPGQSEGAGDAEADAVHAAGDEGGLSLKFARRASHVSLLFRLAG